MTVSANYDTDFFVTWAFSAWIRIFPDRILADSATGKKVLSGSGKKDADPTHRKVKLRLLKLGENGPGDQGSGSSNKNRRIFLSAANINLKIYV